MNIFSLEYSEYAIAGLLQDEFPKSDNYSISIPLKRQQKDYDLLLFNANNRKAVTIQVKSSRTYLETKNYDYIAWLNNFKVNEYADFYFIHIVYPELDNSIVNSKFHSKVLVFNKAEMAEILANVKTKKTGNPEKFFGFGFNKGEETIYGNRGFVSEERQEFSANLFENKLAEIKGFIG